MNVLTTGGSLLSVLPSDILLSEPQEVGEYSLCWTERQQTVLIWSLYQKLEHVQLISVALILIIKK